MKQKIKKKIPIFVLFFMTILIQYVQLKNKNMYLGDDWIFHYNRFYDAAQQIKERNFQYFISMYGFSQSGRIVNAVYGPLFAYLNGFLLLICKSWYNYQLLSNFLITFLSSLSMFFLLSKLNIRSAISTSLSLIYSALYVVQSWTFNQTLGNWGAVLFPLAILASVDFSSEKYTTRKCLFLIAVMDISIQTHLLTSLLMIMVLLIFFVIALVKSNHKTNLLVKVVMGALVTLCLTANVWYPLIEVNIENQLLRPFLNMNMEKKAIGLITNDNFNYFTVLVAALFFIQLIFSIFLKVNNEINKYVTLTALFFFILSSKLLPWNNWALNHPSITIVQFPFRFFIPAVALLICGLGLSIEIFLAMNKDKKNINIMTCMILSLLVFISISNHYENCLKQLEAWNSPEVQAATTKNDIFYTDDDSLIRKSFFDKTSLLTALNLIKKSTPDYSPVASKDVIFDKNFHGYDEYKRSIFEKPSNMKIKESVKNNSLILEWTGSGKKEQLPVLIYKRTKAILNGEELKRNNFKTDNIGAIIIDTKKGDNTLIINYENSYLFYLIFLESIVSNLCFFGLWLKMICRRK